MSSLEELQPSDIYPAFKWDRLIALGALITKARRWVAEAAVPDDSLCSIGLRGWEHTRKAIIRGAAKEFADWLSVTNPGRKFRFKLDMMPIQFCRGDANNPLPTKYAFSDRVEREQTELAFQVSALPAVEGFFRVLVETDKLGMPLDVHLVLANLDGSTAMSWKIPREDSDSGATPIVLPQAPISLGPLTLKTKSEIEAEEKAAADRASEATKKSDKNGA